MGRYDEALDAYATAEDRHRALGMDESVGEVLDNKGAFDAAARRTAIGKRAGQRPCAARIVACHGAYPGERAPARPAAPGGSGRAAGRGEAIVKLKPDATISRINASYATTTVEEFLGSAGIYRLKIPSTQEQ